MKNLVTKAGAIAVTSVLIPCVAFAPEAKALDLIPSDLGILVNATGSVNDTVLYDLEGRASANPALNEPGVVEIGEFYYDDQTNIEMRGYAEFDLTSLIPLDDQGQIDYNEVQTILNYGQYSIGFNVLSQGGSGTAGNGSRNNLNNPYTGIVEVLWYVGTALSDPLAFNPLIGPSPYNVPFVGTALNPLYSFQVGGSQTGIDNYAVGDRVQIDATSLVRNLLLGPVATGSDFVTPLRFGVMLKASSLTDPGACGGTNQRACQGITFNNFGATAVPTPAAILPTLFGMITAAIRKNKHQNI